MTADLRAAAERLRQLMQSRGGTSYSGVSRDVGAVIDFALGLLDETPVDEAWLLSEGWIQDEKAAKYGYIVFRWKFKDVPYDQQFGDVRMSGPSKGLPESTWHATVAAGGGWVGPVQTRGNVRSLLHALQGPTP